MPFVTSAGRRKQRQNRVNALDLQMIDAGNRYDQRYSQTAPELRPIRPPNALGIDRIRAKNLLRANSGYSDFADYRMQNRVLEATQAPVLQAQRAKSFYEAALSNQMTDMAPQIAGTNLDLLRLPLSEFRQRATQQQFENEASRLAASNTQGNLVRTADDARANQDALNEREDLKVNSAIANNDLTEGDVQSQQSRKGASDILLSRAQASATENGDTPMTRALYQNAQAVLTGGDPVPYPDSGQQGSQRESYRQQARTGIDVAGAVAAGKDSSGFTSLFGTRAEDGSLNGGLVNSLPDDSFFSGDNVWSDDVHNVLEQVLNRLQSPEFNALDDTIKGRILKELMDQPGYSKIRNYRDADNFSSEERWDEGVWDRYTKGKGFAKTAQLSQQIVSLVERNAPQLSGGSASGAGASGSFQGSTREATRNNAKSIRIILPEASQVQRDDRP